MRNLRSSSGSVLFDDDLSFEVETGAIAPVFMSIPGITVGAAMFAALVGVHAIPHAYVGAVHFVDDPFGIFFQVLGGAIGLHPFIDRLDMFFDPFVFQKPVLRD
jgi:hypothetical protein